MSDKYENWNSGDFIDECEANRMEIGSLTASRDEWERLWKKASISVIDLQDRVAQLESAYEHQYKMLKETSESEDRLQARVDELEADAAQARYRMNEEKRMKALANSGGRP